MRRMAINFINGKGKSYSETVKLATTTGNIWLLAAGEAVRSLGISAPD